MAEMFDINGGEMLIIMLVALIVVGPQRLPEMARKVGGWMREIRAVAADFRSGLEREIAELERPVADLKEDLTKPLQAVGEDVKAVSAEVDEVGRSFSRPLAWTGPVSERGPSPDDAADDLAKIDRGEDPDPVESTGEPIDAVEAIATEEDADE